MVANRQTMAVTPISPRTAGPRVAEPLRRSAIPAAKQTSPMPDTTKSAPSTVLVAWWVA
jgi:hypothetical protein